MTPISLPFVKMNGAGNDFVVVNALEQPFAPTPDQVRAICDRRTGQGCDQLIALEPVCVLTLANTLNGTRAASLQPFGPALNLGQKAAEHGIRHLPVKARG